MPPRPAPSREIPPPGTAPLMRPTLLWGVERRNPWAAVAATVPPKPLTPMPADEVAPFIEKLRTPETGAIRNATHVAEWFGRVVDGVLAAVLLRAPLFALIGYLIGMALDGVVDPYSVEVGRREVFVASTALAGAATGFAAGLSFPLFLKLMMIGAYEYVGVMIILGYALARAFHALAERLAVAFAALPF
jgi:hypothetical protein